MKTVIRQLLAVYIGALSCPQLQAQTEKQVLRCTPDSYEVWEKNKTWRCLPAEDCVVDDDPEPLGESRSCPNSFAKGRCETRTWRLSDLVEADEYYRYESEVDNWPSLAKKESLRIDKKTREFYHGVIIKRRGYREVDYDECEDIYFDCEDYDDCEDYEDCLDDLWEEAWGYYSSVKSVGACKLTP